MSDSIIIEQPTGLSGFTIGDLGVFIGTLGSVITGILIALQHSKCKKIKCCGCECDRDVNADEPQPDRPVAEANEERERIRDEVEAIVPPQENQQQNQQNNE
jgi:hypothetical protein